LQSLQNDKGDNVLVRWFISLLFLVSCLKNVYAEDFRDLSQKVLQGRQEVEQLNQEQSQTHKIFQAELDLLIQRKTELDQQIFKERLKNQQLQIKKDFLKQSQKSDVKLSKSEKKQIMDWLLNLEKWVQASLPYRREVRWQELQDIKTQIQNNSFKEDLVRQLWAFTEKEIKLGQDNHYEIIDLEIDQKKQKVESVRLGWVQMYYRTPEGKWGSFKKESQKVEGDLEEKTLERLFKKLKSREEKGYFEIPYFSALGGAFLQMGGALFIKESFADTLNNSKDSKESSLMQAFVRELAFLEKQKMSFNSSKPEFEKRHHQRKQELQNQVQKREVELVQWGAKNEILFNEIQAYEKQKKNLQNQEYSLLTVFKKATQQLNEVESSLQFERYQGKNNFIDSIEFGDFDRIFKRAMVVLDQSSKIEEIQSQYIYEDRLTKGSVRRFGLVAAQALMQKNEVGILGPNGEGQMKILEVVQDQISSFSVYLYENLVDGATYKRTETLADRFASGLPLAILVFVFAMVFGLFVMFARE